MNAAFCCAQVADGIDKIGPCGGGGEHCDVIKIPHCLESITVRTSLIVDSIQCSYLDQEGTLHTTDRWGGPGGFEHVTVIYTFQTFHTTMHKYLLYFFIISVATDPCHLCFQIKLGAGTSLKRMSGTYAPFSDDETVVITSLTFGTSDNVKYGPLGAGGGVTFDIHLNEASIVGFFVRAGWFIDAIGVYVRR